MQDEPYYCCLLHTNHRSTTSPFPGSLLAPLRPLLQQTRSQDAGWTMQRWLLDGKKIRADGRSPVLHCVICVWILRRNPHKMVDRPLTGARRSFHTFALDSKSTCERLRHIKFGDEAVSMEFYQENIKERFIEILAKSGLEASQFSRIDGDEDILKIWLPRNGEGDWLQGHVVTQAIQLFRYNIKLFSPTPHHVLSYIIICNIYIYIHIYIYIYIYIFASGCVSAHTCRPSSCWDHCAVAFWDSHINWFLCL